MADLERIENNDVEENVDNHYEEKEEEDTEVTNNEETETQTEIVPKKKSVIGTIAKVTGVTAVAGLLYKFVIEPIVDKKRDVAAENRLIKKGYVVIKPEHPEVEDSNCDVDDETYEETNEETTEE